MQTFDTNYQYCVSGGCCSHPDQGESQKLVFQILCAQCCNNLMYQEPCREAMSMSTLTHQELPNPDIQGRGRPTGWQNTIAESDVAAVTERFVISELQVQLQSALNFLDDFENG